jgi:hypothetical protein
MMGTQESNVRKVWPFSIKGEGMGNGKREKTT